MDEAAVMEQAAFDRGVGAVPHLETYSMGSLELQVQLAGKPVRIGRATSCELRLNDAKVSRQHAEIRPEGGGWMLVNHSQFGTRVNAQLVKKSRRLEVGDRLFFGARYAVVLVEDDPARNTNTIDPGSSDAGYRSLFTRMVEAFALCEVADGRPGDYLLLQVNPAFERLTGRPVDQLTGRLLGAILPEPDGAWRQQLERVAATGESVLFEYWSQALERHLQVQAFRPSRGKLALLLQDVTPRIRLEEERRRMEALAFRNERMECLGSLAGGVAHDMNNVLGAVLSLASINEATAAPDTPLREDMATIVKACRRGGAMMKRLLGFARENLPEERVLDLNTVVQEEAALLERTTLQRVKLVMNLAEGLAPIKGDPAALCHALMNLCVNAVDAMPAGGVLTLVTRDEPPGSVILEVSDTGSGMPREVLDRALDPFFTTKPQGKGTGLGLPIVYGTVKAHRGTMELRSRPGEGTMVTLRFPACQPAAGPRAAGGGALRASRQVLPGAAGGRRRADPGLRPLGPGDAGPRDHHGVGRRGGAPAARGGAPARRAHPRPEDARRRWRRGPAARPRAASFAADPGRHRPGRPVGATTWSRSHPGVTLLAKPFSFGELQRALDAGDAAVGLSRGGRRLAVGSGGHGWLRRGGGERQWDWPVSCGRRAVVPAGCRSGWRAWAPCRAANVCGGRSEGATKGGWARPMSCGARTEAPGGSRHGRY